MSIDKLRKKIDKIDDEIIRLLEERMSLVGDLKLHKSSITDEAREGYILNKTDSVLIREIYKAIFEASKKHIQKP